VVAAGTPEEVATVETSHTGWFLRKALGKMLDPSVLGALQESP
jgi:hypothetical protein